MVHGSETIVISDLRDDGVQRRLLNWLEPSTVLVEEGHVARMESTKKQHHQKNWRKKHLATGQL
jgi:hypothetical protein